MRRGEAVREVAARQPWPVDAAVALAFDQIEVAAARAFDYPWMGAPAAGPRVTEQGGWRRGTPERSVIANIGP